MTAQPRGQQGGGVQRPTVVIIGGGFGGLEAARALARKPVNVVVVDRQNHHLFQPLLYQVATAALSPGDIASPIRSILRRARNVRVVLAEAEGIDPDRRCVLLNDGAALPYDYLIVATGSRHAYFGHDEWEPYAPGLKTIEDALEVRRRVLLAYELAEREPDAEARRALMTFVLVGGGPTGVELAGMLAEMAHDTLVRDFREIDTRQTRIVLVEAGPRILPAFSADLAAAAERDLRRLGVDVQTDTRVTGIAPEGVTTSEGFIPARVALWTAGNAASPLARTLGVPLDRVGRVPVEPDLSLAGRPEVFVVGDLSLFTHQTGQPLPGVAPVAMQQGKAAAQNILRSLRGEPRRTFAYVNHGSPAVIGRASAIFDFGRLHLTGFVGWLLWLFVHIYFLVGFENRLLVMSQWAWSFFTHQRGARLITGPVGPGGVAAMTLPTPTAAGKPPTPPDKTGTQG